MEQWKQISGYEGFYEVSNLGRVRSVRRTFTRSDGKVKTFQGKILSPGKKTNGYLFVGFSRIGKRKAHHIHRLVASAFIPNPEDKPFVNHKNLDKSDNRASNLEWVTHSQNIQHAKDNGVYDQYKGEGHWLTTLTDDEVIEIFRRAHNGELQSDIAQDYGISQTAVSRIKRHVAWSHVTKLLSVEDDDSGA